jgi:3-oxoacyl-[acyl-carrier-protein] synthase III
MRLPEVSLVDVSSYLPGNRIGIEYFTRFQFVNGPIAQLTFDPPNYRHHIAPDETPADMVEKAVAPLIERHGVEAISDIDVLLTHTEVARSPIHGDGGEIARRLGLAPAWTYDIRSGGCAAFVQMMSIARMVLQTTSATTALIVAVQNGAGSVYAQSDVRKLPLASVPGDGCGVGLLRKTGDAPILDIECRTYPEFVEETEIAATRSDRKFWEPGDAQPLIKIAESRITRSNSKAGQLVPEVGLTVCERLEVKSTDVDHLVTNQPNRTLLQSWRDALGIPAERHTDSFDQCGDLFAAGIPVTLDIENRAGRIPNGSLVLIAASAHTGTFAAAAAVRWHAAPDAAL